MATSEPQLDINELALALDIARGMVDLDRSTLYLACMDAADKVRRKCRPQLTLEVLNFIELATWEFQRDPSLYGKLAEALEAHRMGRSLKKTLIQILKACPRSFDFLSFMNIFLPKGWMITMKINPQKQSCYDAFAILGPGEEIVCLMQVNPPIVPQSYVKKGEFFNHALNA